MNLSKYNFSYSTRDLINTLAKKSHGSKKWDYFVLMFQLPINGIKIFLSFSVTIVLVSYSSNMRCSGPKNSRVCLYGV